MVILKSKLLKSEQLTHDVFQYDFDFGGTPTDFQPGQFFILKVADGKEPKVNRSYSIASEPNSEFFSLCVKLIPEGRGSEFLRHLPIGGMAEFMAPLGHFFLREGDKDIVMVATGTGLAPFMSMLPRVGQRKVTLLFGVRHREDLFYLEELQQIASSNPNVQLKITLSQPDETWEGEKGRVTDHFEKMDLDATKTQIYICGNGQMVKDIKAMADAKGFVKTDVFLEQFTTV